ncbi:integrase, partial [Acinetobacter baumannii]
MKFVEFFTANIRNPNTRMAYARAVYQFLNWSEERRLPLKNLNPIFVSAYIEQLQTTMAPPSVKQHL